MSPRYPKYKDSGVEWLGEVPAHWPVTSLKRIVEMRSGEAIAGESIFEEGDYPVFGGNGVRGYTSRFTHDGLYALVGRQGALCGNVNYASGKFWASEHAVVCRPRQAVATHWLGELLRAMNLGQYSIAAAQPGLSVDVISRIEIPVPPQVEQEAIAAFLEREAAKIDGLVAEQERLIELLKEKRQAVISHAVTKGLNPDARMKDSGIEWLGQVPAHWSIGAVRRYLSNLEQGWSPECDARPAEAEEWGVLKAGCVNRGVYVQEENKALPTNLDPIAAYEVHVGDVLVCRASGSPELVGSTAMVASTRPRLMLSDKIFRVRLSDNLLPEFFVAAFNSRSVRCQIERAISGADGLANNLPQAELRAFFLGVPPIEEQRSIVKHLTEALHKIDRLAHEAESAIELLQERRTALISAAVTGQIDVRPESMRDVA